MLLCFVARSKFSVVKFSRLLRKLIPSLLDCFIVNDDARNVFVCEIAQSLYFICLYYLTKQFLAVWLFGYAINHLHAIILQHSIICVMFISHL
jgi:hypothetical protein